MLSWKLKVVDWSHFELSAVLQLTALEQQLAETNQKLAIALSSVDEEQAVTRGVLEEAQRRGLLADQLQRELDAVLAEMHHYEHQHAEHARSGFQAFLAARHLLGCSLKIFIGVFYT